VYDLDSRGKKTTRSVSQTHRVERIVIRQFGDAWFFDECQISSSSADQTGIVESLGSVEWLADGIRLTGEEGAAERLGPDGKQTLGSAVFTLEIRRQGQVLNYRYDSQAYRLAKTPSGQLLQSPDTLSPLGKPFSKQETSESWFAGHD